jgi:hypothetical protein
MPAEARAMTTAPRRPHGCDVDGRAVVPPPRGHLLDDAAPAASKRSELAPQPGHNSRAGKNPRPHLADLNQQRPAHRTRPSATARGSSSRCLTPDLSTRRWRPGRALAAKSLQTACRGSAVRRSSQFRHVSVAKALR